MAGLRASRGLRIQNLDLLARLDGLVGAQHDFVDRPQRLVSVDVADQSNRRIAAGEVHSLAADGDRGASCRAADRAVLEVHASDVDRAGIRGRDRGVGDRALDKGHGGALHRWRAKHDHTRVAARVGHLLTLKAHRGWSARTCALRALRQRDTGGYSYLLRKAGADDPGRQQRRCESSRQHASTNRRVFHNERP